MDRALKILAALFATAAVLQLIGCVALGWHSIREFPALLSNHRKPAVLGLVLGYGVMFLMIYARIAHLIWRRRQWNKAMLLAAASFFGFPVGPVLGLAALILLTRPAAKVQFAN